MSESDAENLNDYSLVERLSSNRANYRIHAYHELESASKEEHVEFYNSLWNESSGFEGIWLNERGKAAIEQASSTLHIILKSLSEESSEIIDDFFEVYLLNLLKNCTLLKETSSSSTNAVKRSSPSSNETKVDTFLIYLTQNGNILRNFVVALKILKEYQEEKCGLYPIKGPAVKQILRVVNYINKYLTIPTEEEYAKREDYESIDTNEVLSYLGKLYLIPDGSIRTGTTDVFHKLIDNRIVSFSKVDTVLRNIVPKDNRTKKLISVSFLSTYLELRSYLDSSSHIIAICREFKEKWCQDYY